MIKVTSEEILQKEAWFEDLPRRTKLWFNLRCALREMFEFCWIDDSDRADELALLGFRSLIIASATVTSSNTSEPKLENAAKAAYEFFAAKNRKSVAFANTILSLVAIIWPEREIRLSINSEPTRFASLERDSSHLEEWPPLWLDKKMPEKVSVRWEAQKQKMQRAPEKWGFWLEWYDAILDGSPLSWDLCRQIAREVTEVEWDAGPEVVAKRIEEIRASFEPDLPLSKDQLQHQVKTLVAKPNSSVTAARGLQSLIQMALDAYRREISNALPDALEPLDSLPPILNEIATVLSGELSPTDKERELIELVGNMAQVIAVLNYRLKTTHSKLGEASRNPSTTTPKQLFADAFYTQAGKGAASLVTSKTLWGGVIAGATLFLGADADALTEGLGHCFQTIIAPENQDMMPENPRHILPPSTEV